MLANISLNAYKIKELYLVNMFVIIIFNKVSSNLRLDAIDGYCKQLKYDICYELDCKVLHYNKKAQSISNINRCLWLDDIR